jgi:hypothetical protein
VAHLRKPGFADHVGFDPSRNLQILPINQRTNFYLVAGSDLKVFTDDDSCAGVVAGDDAAAHKDKSLTSWEKAQEIRKLTIVGRSLGSTTLRAQLDGPGPAVNQDRRSQPRHAAVGRIAEARVRRGHPRLMD